MKKEEFEKWKESKSDFDYDEAFISKQIKRSQAKVLKYLFRSAFCLFSLLFILSNTSESFVEASSNIYILRNIVSFLDLTPSIQYALDHDYVQIIDKTFEEDDIKVDVEFLVADERRIDIFYTVEKDGERLNYSNVEEGYEFNLTYDNDLKFSGSSWTSDDKYDHGTFELIYGDEKMSIPKQLNFKFLVKDEEITFTIDVDQSKIAKKKEFEINHVYEIEGQLLTIEKVEVYPLNMIIYTSQDENNTYEISSLKFDFIETDLTVKNGTTRFNDMYFLESSYFFDENIELILKSAELIEKDQYVIFDLKTEQLNDPFHKIELLDVKRTDDELQITIKAIKEFPQGVQLLSELDGINPHSMTKKYNRHILGYEETYIFPLDQINGLNQLKFKMNRGDLIEINESILIDLKREDSE